MARDNIAIVDGSNVAFAELSQQGEPKVSNLVAIGRAPEAHGYRPIIIVDATLRHQVDDPEQLEGLLDKQEVRRAPAGTDADFFVLETAGRWRRAQSDSPSTSLRRPSASTRASPSLLTGAGLLCAQAEEE